MAKYLRLWGGSGVKVTLIEKNPSYISNILSNSVLYGKKNPINSRLKGRSIALLFART